MYGGPTARGGCDAIACGQPSAAVRIGIQLPEVEREVRWPEYLAMARAAEAAGFDSIWLGDHLLYRGDGRPERGPWEAWTLLAALAAATERVRLGPLVACAGFHPPGLIAKMAATIDEVSGGRFVLGLGRGLERGGVPRVRPPVRPPRVALRGVVRDRPRAARRRARDARRPLLAGRRRGAAARARRARRR